MSVDDKRIVNMDSKDIPESLKLAQEESTEYDEAKIVQISHVSQIMSILVSGIALFSDGYNAQISEFFQSTQAAVFETATRNNK